MTTPKTPKTTAPAAWYKITPANAATAAPAEIYIYDVIVDYAWDDDETTAKGFIDDLKALGPDTPLDLHINSPGGSVFAGLAIYNALQRHQAQVTVYIDGLAASIASVVAMAGDRIVMPENALLMIHNPYSFAGGTAAELRKAAEMLDKATASIISTYQQQTNLDTATLAKLMDEETWLSAAEAADFKFIDEIEPALPMAALSAKLKAFDLSQYNNAPALNRGQTPIKPPAPQNNQPSTKAPATEPKGKGATPMTKEELKQNHPETYAAIFTEGETAGLEAGKKTGIEEGKTLGAKAEQERIKAVEAQLIPGHETLIASLKADGKTTGPEAAMKVLAAEKVLRRTTLENLTGDTVPEVPPAADDSAAQAEEAAVVAGILAGMKTARPA